VIIETAGRVGVELGIRFGVDVGVITSLGTGVGSWLIDAWGNVGATKGKLTGWQADTNNNIRLAMRRCFIV
jgi:hypothetical protein